MKVTPRMTSPTPTAVQASARVSKDSKKIERRHLLRRDELADVIRVHAKRARTRAPRSSRRR